jgi:hypothetical protein
MNIPRAVLVVSGSVMIFACVGGIKAQGSQATPDQNSTPRTGQMARRYESLETAASKANPQDRNSVVALTDEVFKVPHYGNYMPAALQASVKNRLVDAEMSHRRGANPGISEEAVVQVINSTAERFGLPEYAKTNASQVRYLRMHMALTSPIFMGAGMTRPDAVIGDQINSTMSPAQAIHLIQVLADQKYSNPTYQVSPADWDPNDVRSPFDGPSGMPPSGAILQTFQNPKRDEMRKLISNASSGMNNSDVQGLLEQALRTLGM